MSYFINANFVDGQFEPIDPNLPLGFCQEIYIRCLEDLEKENEELMFT